jgi:hypothetical protein
MAVFTIESSGASDVLLQDRRNSLNADHVTCVTDMKCEFVNSSDTEVIESSDVKLDDDSDVGTRFHLDRTARPRRQMVPPPRQAKLGIQFNVQQQWEGIVTEVLEDSFVAKLHDLTDQSRPMEFVELPLTEISSDDRSLLTVGAVFYWCIGHQITPGNQISRRSDIRLRRTRTWSRKMIQDAQHEAEILFEQCSE